MDKNVEILRKDFKTEEGARLKSTVQELLERMEELQEFSGTAHSTRELLEAADSLNLDGVSADFRTGHLILELPFSENQSLLAELSPNIADSGQELHLEILSWQTISTGTWNPDTKQPVLNAKENTP